jgi:hypothetical protein
MSNTVKILILQPCHENWHNMTPNEQGRFCGSCQKSVVDFSLMTDKEMLDYMAKVSGYTACGRFSNDQLNKNIKAGQSKRRFSWAYIWNIMLATFLVTEANAQVKQKKKAPVQHRELTPRKFKPSIVSINKPDSVDQSISTVGYKPKMMDLENKPMGKQHNINELLFLTGKVGGYTVGMEVPKTEKIKRVINSCIPASLKKDVTIYPNPVMRGNSAQVKLAFSQTGEYQLEVLSTSGQIMLVKTLFINTKEQQVEIDTEESWSAGTYWVRISSNKTKKIYNSKLLLQ